MKNGFLFLLFMLTAKFALASKEFFRDADVFAMLAVLGLLVLNYIFCFILAYRAWVGNSKALSIVALLLSLVYAIPVVISIVGAMLSRNHSYDVLGVFQFLIFALIMLFPFLYAMDKMNRVYKSLN